MLDYQVIHGFSNVGFASPARSFAGFLTGLKDRSRFVSPRDVMSVEIQPGDLLSIIGLRPGEELLMAAFDDKGGQALMSLGASATSGLDIASADCAPLLGWIASKGGDPTGEIPVAVLAGEGEQLVVKATASVTVWIVNPADRDRLVQGKAGGSITVSHQPADKTVPLLPPLLGDLRDEFTVPRGTGMAYEVKKGEIIQIIDIEGQQCSDFVAVRRDRLDKGEEWTISSTATRSMVHMAYPQPGMLDKFYDREMQPLLSLVQDTCGRHDTFGLACNARGYEERGFPGHVNCSDNISHALAPFGVQRRGAWPAINFFWSTWVEPTSQNVVSEDSHSRPGDYVAMRVLEDLVCASTACPDDIDPINGWNPTDIHVRIYRPNAPIRRAVGYREKEDAPMSISDESAFHERQADLTQQFAPVRDLWVPVSYPSHGTLGEYWACRQTVTIQDMSGLRKFDVIGPDAERLLQHATTRNVSKLPTWRGFYTLMCDETGAVIDDGTLFRLSDKLFRWCCGTEESGRALKALASEHGYQVRIHAMRNALPNLALQGPKSRPLLRKIAFTQPQVPAVDQLKWFGCTVARIGDRYGAPFMLSRSGYTGELGYELFCAKADAIEIWDALMDAGEEFGITPMGSAALEIIRIEAGLAAANAEFAPGIDAFEAGLGFAVDLTKEAAFIGKEALKRNARDQRRVLKGLLIDCDDVPAQGAPVFVGERQIGMVTSATQSPMLERGIAIARLSVEFANNGSRVEIGQLDGRMKRLGATVANVPFIDPERKRARA